MWEEIELESAVVFGPKVKLQKGKPCAFIGMEDLNPTSNFVHATKVIDFEGQGGAKFSDGHILFARITPCLQNRKIAQAKLGEHKHGFGSTEFLVFDEKPGVSDRNFLLYLLKTDYVVNHAENSMVGASGRQRADWQYFKTIKIPLPPLPLQRQIAAVLGRYDALIENYKGQVAALEHMAQELYQEWFVRGRYPGAQAESAGELPLGWTRVKFTDVISVQSGGTPKTSEPNYWDGEVYWFSPGDVEDSYYVLTTDKTITEEGLKNCSSKLYPLDTVVITARGTVGKCVMLGRPMAINQSNYALVGLRVSQYFTFFKALEMAEGLQKEANGAVFSTITTDNFERAEILVPDAESLAAFDKLVAPMFGAIRNCLEQSETLRATRDGLLPRLLSGQLLPSSLPAIA